MKAAFNLRGSLTFVGWLAPAYGIDEVNSCGITPFYITTAVPLVATMSMEPLAPMVS